MPRANARAAISNPDSSSTTVVDYLLQRPRPRNLTVQARTLWLVADTLKSVNALSTLLKVTPVELEGWLRGREPVSKNAFLTAVDFVVKKLSRADPIAPRTVMARRKRILVVDDNVDAANVLTWLLRHLGHDVHIAQDGQAAFAIAVRIRPHFVFLDLMLPSMDGFQVAEALKREPTLHATRIVALTGHGADEYRERARDAGIDLYFLKPMDFEIIESLVGRA